MNQEKPVRYWRLTPGTNSFLWGENVRDQNIRFDRYFDTHNNDEEQEVFCHLQVGDIVLTHWEDRYILGVGRVSGAFKRVMRYPYFKQTVPVQWLDIRPRAIPTGENLTSTWTMSDIQELTESDYHHLMDVCVLTMDRIVTERFPLDLQKDATTIQKDQQEDRICDLIEQGKLENALLLVSAENIDLITDYAQDYLAQGDYPHASQFYAKVIELDPGNLGVLNNLAFICLEIGQYTEAVILADQVLSINPEYGCSWLNKGNALIKLGRLQEATDCFNKAKEIDQRAIR